VFIFALLCFLPFKQEKNIFGTIRVIGGAWNQPWRRRNRNRDQKILKGDIKEALKIGRSWDWVPEKALEIL